MGLEDLVPEGKEDTSSRSTSKSSSSAKEEKEVTFGSGQWRKEFSEERWEEVKNVLINKMGLVPNEVVNNYTERERYETLHEAALLSEREIDEEELSVKPDKCACCGNALHEDLAVEIEGEEFCVSHSAGQVRKTLDEN